MGINKKRRRKIVRLDRVFYWYVKSDFDDMGKMKLYILSDNKRFHVAYEIGQAKRKSNSVLVIMGKEFTGLSHDSGRYRRVLTPSWDDEWVTPRLVGKIIDWCYAADKEMIFVDWQGKRLDE